MGKKPFQCSKNRLLRPVKRSTLEKETCEKIMSRLACYGDDVKKRKNGETFLQPIDWNGNDKWEKAMAQTFHDTLEVFATKVCPTIKKSQLLDTLSENFPNHRFNMKYRKVVIPKTFTSAELTQLDQSIGTLTGNNYRLKYNPRLDQHYLSYSKNR